MSRFDERQLTQLMNQFGADVYRFAFSLTKNRSDADDIYQEVFIAYAKNTPTFENDRHAKSWLFTVTSNACKKLWRNPFYSRTEVFDETFHHASQEEKADYTELYEAIQKLSYKNRLVIHLFYFEEYQTKEIAEITGDQESTIRTRLTRARRILKEHLKETHEK